MVVDYEELRSKRAEAANKALISGYSNLNPRDDGYDAKVKALAEIHKQLAADDANRESEYHNRAQEDAEEQKQLSVNKANDEEARHNLVIEKQEERKLTEVEKADDEEARHNLALEVQEEKKTRVSRLAEVGKVVCGIIAGVGALASAASNLYVFNKVTDYEKNVDEGAPGAFRTMGDREVAQEAMRHGFFRKRK